MQTKSRAGIDLGIPHEWSRPFTVEYSFQTEIRTARSGIEQREAVRENPRMTISVNLKDWGPRRIQLQNDLIRDQNATVYLALPWRRDTLAAAAAAGQPSVYISDPLPAWAVPGAYVHIESPDGQEVGLIGSTGLAGQVVLTQNLELAHPSGRVYHALPSRIADEFTLRSPTDRVWTGDVALDVLPGFQAEIDWPFANRPLGAPDYMLFNDRPVILRKPDWRQSIQVTLSKARDVVDFGFGRTETYSPEDFSRQAFRFQFTGKTAPDAERLQTMFRNRYGRRSAFWVPSWIQDFELAATQGASTNFRVKELDAALTFAQSPTHRFLIAKWEDGSYQINEVTDVDPDTEDNVTNFTMADAWEESVLTAQFVHWLLPVRFSTDNLSISWITTNVSEALINVVTVPLQEMGIE